MIDPQKLQKALCAAFCTAIRVEPVPSGYAVSSAFTDRSGDRLSFYLVEDADGYRLEDDGEYLPRLVAIGVDIEGGTRGKLLSAILQNAGADWDRETFEIRTGNFDEADTPGRVVDFLSGLIRARDLELITRDVVRSTFREDAMAAIRERFSDVADIKENQPTIDKDLEEFPPDAVIQPKKGKPAAVYFVTNNEHLSEALLLQIEAEKLQKIDDFSVIALLEEYPSTLISRRKFQRAQNRGLVMPIFRGDENEALNFIGRQLSVH